MLGVLKSDVLNTIKLGFYYMLNAKNFTTLDENALISLVCFLH